jgi:hypothetical protein
MSTCTKHWNDGFGDACFRCGKPPAAHPKVSAWANSLLCPVCGACNPDDGENGIECPDGDGAYLIVESEAAQTLSARIQILLADRLMFRGQARDAQRENDALREIMAAGIYIRPRADRDGFTAMRNGRAIAGGSWNHCVEMATSAAKKPEWNDPPFNGVIDTSFD